MGADVTTAVQFFFCIGMLVPGLNSSFMVIIPKMPDASVIEHFWPTFLSNFLNKIISMLF